MDLAKALALYFATIGLGIAGVIPGLSSGDGGLWWISAFAWLVWLTVREIGDCIYSGEDE